VSDTSEADGASIQGTVSWRRFPTDEPWQSVPLIRHGDELRAGLPHQPPAGKIEYSVSLTAQDVQLHIPEGESAIARFTGAVPTGVLIMHIFLMFCGMLWSVRAGLEAVAKGPSLRRQTWLAFGLLAVGGFILGPIVQKYAFGAFWTGWPLGEDLTDNKLAVAVLAWLVALWRTRGCQPPVRSNGRWWVVAATLVVLVIFSIPHSLHGSQLDYETMQHVQG
jgi:hypothetical protein